MESVFTVLAEPSRRAILGLLADSERSVGDIEKHLRLPQPSVSKHLRVLKDAGFVESRADAPRLLEDSWGGNDMRWELEPQGAGTRLTLWHNIDKGFISMGAAGWHICFDVLEQLLADAPIGRIVGMEAMKFGWPRLNAEYAKQFGVEPPAGPPEESR